MDYVPLFLPTNNQIQGKGCLRHRAIENPRMSSCTSWSIATMCLCFTIRLFGIAFLGVGRKCVCTPVVHAYDHASCYV